MKKYLFGLSAVVLATAFSAFTIKPNAAPAFVNEKFAEYTSTTGTNPEKQASNYTIITQFNSCAFSTSLCKISFDDVDSDNVLDQTELDAVFTTRDTDSDNLLSDQAEVGTYPRIEKKL